MSSDAAERRILAALICLVGGLSLLAWTSLLIPSELVSELLDAQRGSPFVRSVAKIIPTIIFTSPVLLGVSLWALKRIWASVSGATRMCLTVLAAAPASWLLYLLFQVLILTTVDFR
jgi:hypothetical protein